MSLDATAILVTKDGKLNPVPLMVGEKFKIKGIPCVLSYINKGKRRLTFTVDSKRPKGDSNAKETQATAKTQTTSILNTE